ncbi:MAG TPA: M28 family peptidase [Blastocatellia bacterium]|jgi:hypothetical protein
MRRREFIGQASAITAALHSPISVASQTPDLSQRIARVIGEYDRQGGHRTGSDVDTKSARWLAGAVTRCGLNPSLEAFIINRVDLKSCYLLVGGRRIEGLPIFDGGFTDAVGARGKFGQLGSETEIGVVEFPPNAEYGPTYLKMRRETRHRAIVIVTRGARSGLTPINAPNFNEPFGPPVLQVSSEEGTWLKEQAGKNAEATLVAQVKRTKAQAFNVTARIAGADPKLAPLVVMTPRSGWGHCASERGGGLACWLEAMRGLAAASPPRGIWFLASSGHELGHIGLEAFMELRHDLVKTARAWIHFGANIGAAQESSHRLQASTDEFEQIAIAAMKTEGTKADEIMPRGAAPFGEAGHIHRGGGQYLSLLGRNALFHHPADRWPEAVDVAAVARLARAFVKVAITMAQ